MGLGPYPEVGLAEARDAALTIAGSSERESIRSPSARDQAAHLQGTAEALIESKKPGWRNAKHASQWTSTLATHAYPKLGGLDVKSVGTQAVLDVLRPIWTTKTETASRVRQRIEAVLDYATAIKARSGENPARWKGHLDHLLAKPSKVRRVKHHPAMAWQDAPAFMVELSKRDGEAAKALAFTVLTAARSGEVRGMRWRELDLEAKVWTVPAGRIKGEREHRVPLQDAAIALLGAVGKPDELVFTGAKTGKPLSDMSLSAVLRRMKIDPEVATVHGFRSTFRDWTSETTTHSREVIESALAHKLKDKAEAAYARGDLFAKRRKLMQDWAEYLAAPPAQVVELQRPAGSAATV